MNLKRVLFAALITMLPFSAYAHGKHHHRHIRHRHHAVHPLDIRPSRQVNAERLIRVAESHVGSGNITGFHGAWCGAYMKLVARQVGARVPTGYLAASSWAHAGPRVRPQRGAVMVEPHHVSLVLKVVGDRALTVSGNFSHRVSIAWLYIRRAIAFVKIV